MRPHPFTCRRSTGRRIATRKGGARPLSHAVISASPLFPAGRAIRVHGSATILQTSAFVCALVHPERDLRRFKSSGSTEGIKRRIRGVPQVRPWKNAPGVRQCTSYQDCSSAGVTIFKDSCNQSMSMQCIYYVLLNKVFTE
ncbi:hypothetical protein Zmor_000725 [Zophobas morio]|uniref:Uncharacterized protein n=1 Tax=Zophobas morio TaxID=2755281 RepID=A0AA38J6Y4_9CUCU|nr:hypothetical protein Zmor_000725 [Zophobas morio]